ncbi:FAD-dependent oxidoreductase [Streptomyces sp. ISL-10]|uniref:FAD-dependent oxidoreductase n=1 Tax=Streptomyces sp. ISL-10 TaxID=2819172 RepID=UPI001BE8398B|nr:FAD-dependent oxidoreductase [Streptomyces sp. ISL-10]MBT2365862.1 FAD-dependent oxidoreductase [Streptomyces sp. ISL-10]
MHTEYTRCVVVGGGPAGMMAGLLLARQGVEVVVLEKHGDFLRDFRGDTVHPSTLRLIEELGWIDEFLALPHSKVTTISVETPAGRTDFADFSKIGGKHPYIAFMPQWDVLDFLARKGSQYPGFRLIQKAEATELVRDGDEVLGVRATTPNGPMELRADVVIAADGRHSAMRGSAGLQPSVSQAPMDVLWFRISRLPDERLTFLHTGEGFVLITIDRGTYWQMAYVIPQGAYEKVRDEGIERLRADVSAVNSGLGARMSEEIGSWDDVKLLTVRVDRLRTWHRPGLLCIGDAAHAMSPAGGVGINLAVQDAVAAARILGPVLRAGRAPDRRDLNKVQRRRELPVRAVQLAQVHMLADLYPKNRQTTVERPLAARVVRRFSFLNKWTAMFIGVGIRPEHIGPAMAGVGARSGRRTES